MTVDTIPARVQQRAARVPDRPAYAERGPDRAWRTTSWGRYGAEVRVVARALAALGVEPGDRLCILGGNRPEWLLGAVGAMTAGAVPAGIYTTCSPSEVAYVVAHSDAAVVIVDTLDQLAKLRAKVDELPKLRHVVLARGLSSPDPLALPWEAFLARAAEAPDSVVDERLAALREADLAVLIYTSGTTGPPKAVMLTHRACAHTASVATSMAQATEADRLVSYLPLSHIAEQMFTIHGHATAGYQVSFAESVDTLLADLQDVHPTLVFGVPRVWEKMHARLEAALAEATGIKAVLVRWARGVGLRVNEARFRGETPSGWLALQYALARRRVFGPIHQRLGLDRTRFGISGAAPIGPEVLRFFASIDLPIHEVYGQSEGCGPTTFNLPGRTRLGTVGVAIPGTEVRIADDGEVLVRGDNVFAGYFKDPQATAETLVDGWLHSGDLGAFDTDGFLTITGRKKEILITSGGKNIAPKNLEAALRNLPLVSQAVVIGDRRKFLSALVTLDPAAAEAFAAARGLPRTDLHAQPAIRAEIQRGIDEQVNPEVARVESIRRFTLLPRDFTQEDGELTPTMKIRRKAVNERWAAEIEAMYAEEGG